MGRCTAAQAVTIPLLRYCCSIPNYRPMTGEQGDVSIRNKGTCQKGTRGRVKVLLLDSALQTHDWGLFVFLLSLLCCLFIYLFILIIIFRTTDPNPGNIVPRAWLATHVGTQTGTHTYSNTWVTRGRAKCMADANTYMCTANCPRTSTTMYTQQIEGGGRAGASVLRGLECDMIRNRTADTSPDVIICWSPNFMPTSHHIIIHSVTSS
jgi:hypothetical protein